MGFMANMMGNKAYSEHRKGNHAKALEMYNEAYAKGMDKPQFLRGYSILLIRSGDYDKADLHMNYAIILWKKGHLDHALEILENDFKQVKNGMIYSIIGYLKIEKGDAQEALRFNQEALEYDDEDPVFLDNMAQVYYRLFDDKEKAKPYFEKAIKFKPGAIDTNYFLALYDIEAGDKETARERLERVRNGNFSPLNYVTQKMIDEKLAQLDE